MVNIRNAFHRPIETQAPLRRIIVPVTGGAEDQRLLEVVDKINRKQVSEITLVYVVEVIQSMPLDAELPLEVERGEQVLAEAEQRSSSCVDNRRGAIKTELLQARAAGAAIVDEAIENDADTILLGATLQKRHGRLVISPTVEYVMVNAPCEVVVIRHAQSSLVEPDGGMQ